VQGAKPQIQARGNHPTPEVPVSCEQINGDGRTGINDEHIRIRVECLRTHGSGHPVTAQGLRGLIVHAQRNPDAIVPRHKLTAGGTECIQNRGSIVPDI